MTQFLPPNLLALFQARDPIPFMPPPSNRRLNEQPYSGVADRMNLFEDPKDTPPPTRGETRDEKKERKRREKLAKVEKDLEEKMAEWDPHSDPNAVGDPFKTLFVARINYETTESKLRRELELYGPIERITMIYDRVTGKSLGYAFVEYEHERDMHGK